ncbi:hypothetical protein HYX07_00290 [Candidatus Woesearchaeota archaeon]|nr:hypothetical protein [Candidatus Woesearchaeota archaeon]
MREFKEITELIEGIELTGIVPDKAKLFIHGGEGDYTIYPIGCRITGYTKRQPTPSQGFPIPVKDTTTEFDNGVRIKRTDVFVSTQVTLYYQAPGEISQRLLEERVH